LRCPWNFQVVLIAALFAICCRNFDLNEDDDMEDDEYDPISVDDTEDWPPASGNMFSSP
jgi:hypothetical protein